MLSLLLLTVLSCLDQVAFHLAVLFFTMVTWGCISPAQISWLCKRRQRQNVHRDCLFYFFSALSSLFRIFFRSYILLLVILCLFCIPLTCLFSLLTWLVCSAYFSLVISVCVITGSYVLWYSFFLFVLFDTLNALTTSTPTTFSCMCSRACFH